VKINIHQTDGYWYMDVEDSGARIRTPFMDTSDRSNVVMYVQKNFPSANIKEKKDVCN
jgi:hypothetical protein